MAEVLAENEGLSGSRKTLRQWLHPLGLRRWRRRRRPHRCRRPRSRRSGEMLFLDSSRHHWFGSGTTTHLLWVDGTTGAPILGLFRPQEDLQGCFRLCFDIFRRYGLPSCFYLDRASQFTTTRQSSFT